VGAATHIIHANSTIEYRILAEDKSSHKNKKMIPSSGFYSVSVFSSLEPVYNYSNDFESGIKDFVLSDFGISRVPGFSNSILHTRHPYPVSAFENEKYNLIAQLRHPVVIQDNGTMEFDEVVLVEPGDPNADYTQSLYWDFVIVEASKDCGQTWIPLIDGYDSRDESTWENHFGSVVNNNTSIAVGSEDLSRKHTISFADNSELSSGDTILIRFRLASDHSVNGWGWAIDNLKVQQLQTGNENLFAAKNINVYPNPFNNEFYLDCSASNKLAEAEVLVTNLQGKIVYQKTNIDLSFDKKIRVDLSGVSPGIYMVNVNDGLASIANNKIVKY